MLPESIDSSDLKIRIRNIRFESGFKGFWLDSDSDLEKLNRDSENRGEFGFSCIPIDSGYPESYPDSDLRCQDSHITD